jgi:hypothetical protein
MRHALLLVPLVAGCLFTQADPPQLLVTSPQRSAVQQDGTLTVTGMATPNSGGSPIARVAVNGTPATLGADGSFSVTVEVPLGGSLIQTTATSEDGGVATDTRAIAVGERRVSGASNPRAIAVQLAPSMFARIAQVATEQIKSAELTPMVRAANPVVDATAAGCFGAQAHVDSVAISDAAVSLVPVDGGLAITATFQQPVITGRMNFAVACADKSATFQMHADRATVRATLVFERGDNGLVPKLDNPAFETPGLEVTTSETIPNTILNILPMSKIIGTVTPVATRMFVDPMIRDAMVDLQAPHQLEVMGKQVTVAGTPSVVEFSPAGGTVMLDLAFALGGGEASKGYTFTPNGTPELAAPDGIGLGISDDLINDALAQLTATGILDRTLPFDGGEFTAIKLTPTLSPMINADAEDGRLQLLLPDMTAQFLDGERVVTTASVNARLAIAVRPAGDGGSVTIDLGEASFSIDAAPDEDGVLTSSGSFAAAIDLGASEQKSSVQLTIGAIPLPKLGELSLSNVSLTADAGYLKAMGTVQ